MKGDGEDCVGEVGVSGRQEDGYNSLYLGMLSHLSRNGLSMLAGGGGSNGKGFSLKPGGLDTNLRNLVSSGARERLASAATGYRTAKVVPNTTTMMSPPMGLLCGRTQEGTKVKEEFRGSPSHRGDQPDVQKLTTDECWRLILKLGTKWPAWNRAATSSQSTQRLMKENDSTHGHPSHNEVRVQGKEKLVRPQDFLKWLATRALDALAQTPPTQYGKAAGGMRAPKQTTQEAMDSKVEGDGPKTPTKATEPTPLAKTPSSPHQVRVPKTTSTRPRTAALTIFYDGIVNVCDNVPADKASLIMMFAEKAGVSLNGQALSRSVMCVTPSLQPSPQAATSSHEDMKASSQVAPLARTSSDDLPSSCTRVEATTSDHEPSAECSNSAKMAIFEQSPLPLKFTITAEDNSRHHVFVKPLPNARKNSLARFLDSRKRSRGTASCCEDVSPKKQALGDGCSPINSDQDLKESEKSPMPSFFFDSEAGICENCHKASQRVTSDAEMQDSLVE